MKKRGGWVVVDCTGNFFKDHWIIVQAFRCKLKAKFYARKCRKQYPEAKIGVFKVSEDIYEQCESILSVRR